MVHEKQARKSSVGVPRATTTDVVVDDGDDDDESVRIQYVQYVYVIHSENSIEFLFVTVSFMHLRYCNAMGTILYTGPSCQQLWLCPRHRRLTVLLVSGIFLNVTVTIFYFVY